MTANVMSINPMMNSADFDTGTKNRQLIVSLSAMYEELRTERDYWKPTWKDISTLYIPRRSRFLDEYLDITNKGLQKDRLDSTALLSTRVLASGMYTYMTSPASPWFALTLSDPRVANRRDIKAWLDTVTALMLSKLGRSNFYHAMKAAYQELGTFGTFFMFLHPDFDEEGNMNLRFDPLTIGTYVIDQNYRQEVDTVFRLMDLTPRQIVGQFGIENVSEAVKSSYRSPRGVADRYNVLHCVYPRTKRELGKLDVENKKYASVYFEYQGKNSQSGKTSSGTGASGYGKILRTSGYDYFPGFGARWDVTDNDIYGRSPAMDSLGDARMLEAMNEDAFKAIHKMIDPPLAAPANEKDINILPGAVNPVDSVGGGQQAVYPIYQVKPDINALEAKITRVQEQLKDIMYVNLFNAISNIPTTGGRTATEFIERKEEKLLMIGPAIERLQNELLKPIVDVEFAIMLENGEIPPWPDPELLGGEELKVEFVSVLGQAQKATQTNKKDRLVTFVGGVAQLTHTAIDTVDYDKLIDDYADDLGIPIEELTSPEQREATRQQRAQQDQVAQQMAMTQQQGDMAKTASETPVNGGESTMLDETLAGADV